MKNPKPSLEVKDISKPKNKIPRMSELFGEDSDEDDLGQGQEKPSSNKWKLSNASSSKVHSLISKDLLPAEMSSLYHDLENLVLHSSSESTWKKHVSAWKLYENFCAEYNVKFKLPITVEYARAFVTWAASKRNLKGSTIKSYVSSLNVAHALSNTPSCNLNSDKCVKMALKGTENISCLKNTVKPDRLPMNVHLLEILSHRLAELDWSPLSKQIVWSACAVCFFTSCRMGELVPTYEKNFDPSTTLMWENVKFSDDGEILIFIPYSKTTGFKGKVVDVFKIDNNKNCPAASLHRLKRMIVKKGYFSESKPVFSFPSGKNLTKRKLNWVLENLLGDFTDENFRITGHSFRAAIPSALSAFPNENSVSNVKDWGSWESSSYNLYLKNEKEKKRALFGKIVSCLYRL